MQEAKWQSDWLLGLFGRCLQGGQTKLLYLIMENPWNFIVRYQSRQEKSWG